MTNSGESWTSLLRHPIGRFRVIAFLEGISFLMLGITMPLKYMLQMPQPNKVVGMAHGALFIAYIFLLGHIALEKEWSLKEISLAFIASLLPFGTFIADAKLFSRKQQEAFVKDNLF